MNLNIDNVYNYEWEPAKFSELKGKIVKNIFFDEEKKWKGSHTLVIETENEAYILNHECESSEEVYIEDIEGNIFCIINQEILLAEESSKKVEDDFVCNPSETWTFYKIATAKGYVTIRWYGGSSGWYSEEVYTSKIKLT